MSLFQSAILRKYLKGIDEKIAPAYKQFTSYFHNPEIQENIRNSKEEQFREGFLRELFVKILGYTLNPEPNYNLITEQKNETDSKKADAAILANGAFLNGAYRYWLDYYTQPQKSLYLKLRENERKEVPKNKNLTRRMANSILFVENYVIKMMLKKVDHVKLMI